MKQQNLLVGLVIFTVVSSSLHSACCQTFDVRDYGAIGDGRTDDSQAFLKAWEALCGATSVQGLPTLIIPSKATFLLQPVVFQGPCKSQSVHLQVLGNIVAPGSIDAWKNCTIKWVAFDRVDNLIIDGSGQIDGHGSEWWKRMDHGKCKRPKALYINKCNGLQLSGLTHLNSPMSHIALNNCHGVTLFNLHIIAPEDSPNTDGIDISRSSNITIRDSFIGTGDDCIAINTGTSYVNITNVACGPGHGISVGSLGGTAQYETVEEVHVSNCSFNGTQNGVRIKTKPDGRGFAGKISFEHITLTETRNPIIIDQNYFARGNDCKTTMKGVKISNITYYDIQGTSIVEEAIKLDCCNIGCTNIVMDHINITSSIHGKTTRAFCDRANGTERATSPAVPCLSRH